MKTNSLTYSFLALREKLHRSALGFLKNDEDAKDALQDTFFNLWKNGPIETDAEAKNKLFAVLRNVCIDRLRKPKTSPLDASCNDSLTVESPLPEDMETPSIYQYRSLDSPDHRYRDPGYTSFLNFR